MPSQKKRSSGSSNKPYSRVAAGHNSRSVQAKERLQSIRQSSANPLLQAAGSNKTENAGSALHRDTYVEGTFKADKDSHWRDSVVNAIQENTSSDNSESTSGLHFLSYFFRHDLSIGILAIGEHLFFLNILFKRILS